MTNLKWFHCTDNQIICLPDEFCNLNNLTQLNLDRNQITNLPCNFIKLSNLKWLSLSDNLLPQDYAAILKENNSSWEVLSESQSQIVFKENLPEKIKMNSLSDLSKYVQIQRSTGELIDISKTHNLTLEIDENLFKYFDDKGFAISFGEINGSVRIETAGIFTQSSEATVTQSIHTFVIEPVIQSEETTVEYKAKAVSNYSENNTVCSINPNTGIQSSFILLVCNLIITGSIVIIYKKIDV